MRKPILVGLHALKTGGKDTTFGFMQEWGDAQGLTAVKRGFADYGKLSFARQYFPDIDLAGAMVFCEEFKYTGEVIVIEHTQWPARKRVHSFEGREPLARLLTEGGRNLHGEDVWVDLLLPHGYTEPDKGGTRYPKWWEEFEYHYQDGPWVADICGVTDVRFENELRRIRQHGGYAVKIKRDKAEQAVIEEAQRKGWAKPHDSELGIPDDQFDYILDNNRDFHHLEVQVFDMMQNIQRRRGDGVLRERVG